MTACISPPTGTTPPVAVTTTISTTAKQASPARTTLAITTPTTAVTAVCPKCGTIKKSGKLSCCARGGSWFKNCGDNGDSKFEHTWVEGVQACNDITSVSLSLKAQVQSMLHNETGIAQERNAVRYRGNESSAASHCVRRNSKGYDEISSIVAFTNLLIIIFYI